MNAEKCGEIYRCGPRKFIFNCAYCLESFDSKTIALDHIENHFLIEIICSTNELDIKTDVSLSPIDELTTTNQSINKVHNETAVLAEIGPNYDFPPIAKQTANHHPLIANHTKTSVLSEIGIQPVHRSLSLQVDPLLNSINLAIKKEPELVTNEEVLILNTKSTQNSCDITEESSTVPKDKRNVECKICGKILRSNSLYYHMRVHAKQKQYTCPKCPKRFNTKIMLSKHTDTHPELRKKDSVRNVTLRKRYKKDLYFPWDKESFAECDICKKKMQKRNLELHMSNHANLKHFTCTVCQKKFNSIVRLRYHTKITHSRREYSCHICAAQFSLRYRLKQHLRVHTGEKPYNCNVCYKQFTQSHMLKEHFFVHTGEKPYTCKLCDQSFRYSSVYRSHLVRHTEEKKYKCDLCARAFSNIKMLQEHRRKHTGERPYLCDVCNQSFARRNAFRQHAILHTGEKPYKCRFCDMQFSQAAGRRSHERSVHKDTKKKFTMFGVVEDTA